MLLSAKEVCRKRITTEFTPCLTLDGSRVASLYKPTTVERRNVASDDETRAVFYRDATRDPVRNGSDHAHFHLENLFLISDITFDV